MEDEQKQHLLFAEETSNDHRDISPAHKSLQLLRPKNPFIFIHLELMHFSSILISSDKTAIHRTTVSILINSTAHES
jgi:hypothetical protein